MNDERQIKTIIDKAAEQWKVSQQFVDATLHAMAKHYNVFKRLAESDQTKIEGNK